MTLLKGIYNMLDKNKLKNYIKQAPNWEEEQIKHLQDPEYL